MILVSICQMHFDVGAKRHFEARTRAHCRGRPRQTGIYPDDYMTIKLWSKVFTIILKDSSYASIERRRMLKFKPAKKQREWCNCYADCHEQRTSKSRTDIQYQFAHDLVGLSDCISLITNHVCHQTSDISRTKSQS